jgi:hypothetical protein
MEGAGIGRYWQLRYAFSRRSRPIKFTPKTRLRLRSICRIICAIHLSLDAVVDDSGALVGRQIPRGRVLGFHPTLLGGLPLGGRMRRRRRGCGGTVGSAAGERRCGEQAKASASARNGSPTVHQAFHPRYLTRLYGVARPE